MRTNTRTFQDSTHTWTYPEAFSFTKSPYQYAMVEISGTSKETNGADAIRLYHDGDMITIKRVIRNNKAVYPLTFALECLAQMANTNVLRNVEMTYDDDDYEYIFGTLNTVVVGYSNREIVQSEATVMNPCYDGICFVYYPYIAYAEQQMDYAVQQIIIPHADPWYHVVNRKQGSIAFQRMTPPPIQDGNLQPFATVYPIEVTEDISNDWPYFDVSHIASGGIITNPANAANSLGSDYLMMQTSFPISDGIHTLSYTILVRIDRCSDGVFLKWLDKSGVPRMYRWTQETTKETIDVDNIYTRLDAMLRPYNIEDKVLTKRYVLHSRLVEQDLYNLCKTILGNQELWMWNPATSVWDRCYLDESDAEDSGEILKDLTIEVVKHEYL